MSTTNDATKKHLNNRVGPVMRAGELATAVIEAAREDNPDREIRVADKLAYIRIDTDHELILRRETIERALGRPFKMNELEMDLSSFAGRIEILKNGLNEAKETIGFALLPILSSIKFESKKLYLILIAFVTLLPLADSLLRNQLLAPVHYGIFKEIGEHINNAEKKLGRSNITYASNYNNVDYINFYLDKP